MMDCAQPSPAINKAMMTLCLLMTLSPAAAQFLPQLQARTPDEFDAYLDVLEAAADVRIRTARQFLSAYPQSELRLPVYETIAKACRANGEAPCALEAAREALRIAPDYIPMLTLLAAVEANTSAKPVEAGPAAERALRLLEQAKAPRRVEAATWLQETARLKAENLAALGVVAFKRGATADAARYLEGSVKAAAIAENQFRLGVLYVELGRAAEARRMLEQAAQSADAALRARARKALDALPRP